MKNTDVRPPVVILVLAISIIVFAVSGCSRGPEANANINTNINTNTSTVANTNTNANINAAPPSTLAAREPNTYRATLVFTAETEGGEKTVGIPPLTAEVARNGEDRRVSFKLPDGSDLIYLDHAGTPYAILPARKQYAELTPAATGFQLHKLMTPGQLVAYLDRLQGIQPVGDETVNGRVAQKYRYARTENTKTSAGEVHTESFVYVDKETGLPLRAELFGEASGNVQGVKGAKIVAEMRDITTNVDPTLFEVPTTYSKVSEQQVRAQVDAITNTVAAVLRTLLMNMNSAPPPPSPTATPAGSPAAAVPPQ
ncbi:MAG TPA: hypothetical protein VHQ94_02615 [Pyrinomonadaceae bacterium]|jgi:hypothetical protein|nr:hypothetical protein [Pyrinomonadaceae bacterium]